MRKRGLLLGLGLLMASMVSFGRPDLEPIPPPIAHRPVPEQPPACAAGCAADPAPIPLLGLKTFNDLLDAFADDPMTGESDALETLLFHGERALELLRRGGAGPLDDERAAFLQRELTRTHALVEVRLVDEAGRERARFQPHRVLLGERVHTGFDETFDLQPLDYSGTVRRVGLHHLWTRL